MKKRFLSLLLTLVMLVGMIPMTSMPAFAATADSVWVGGVKMTSGTYLAVGATATQTTQPSGGYAYYKDGTLTLNNYSYEGEGYFYHGEYADYFAVIYAEQDLSINLIGNNTLTQTYRNSDVIYVDGANLTVGGDGKLTGTSEGYALYADGDLTINGGTVEVSTYYTSIISYGRSVIINDGDITAESKGQPAIYATRDVIVNGGNVTATGYNQAIDYFSTYGLSVAEGMIIQASTTLAGELGEYVAENFRSYKKIVIKPAASTVLLGDINGDGEVNAKDSNLLKQMIAGSIEYPAGSRENLAADINGDGEISAKDSNLLKQMISGAL